MTQVFISYSRNDMEFVQRLAADLQHAGLDVWWDLSDIQGSDVWEMKIEEGLRSSQYFIVVLSPASLKSRWVRREYLSADSKGIKIIPLKLKTYDEAPLTLRDIQPIDAVNRAYENVLSDVLKILKVQAVDLAAAIKPKRLGESPHLEIHDVSFVQASRLDLIGIISLLSFFLFVGFELFDDSSDGLKALAVLTGLGAGFFLWHRKQVPKGSYFKIAITFFIAVYDFLLLNDNYGWEISGLEIIAGTAAVIVAVPIVSSIQAAKTKATFAARFLSLFIFLVSMHLGLNALSVYPAWPYLPTIVVSVLTGVLIWMEI